MKYPFLMHKYAGIIFHLCAPIVPTFGGRILEISKTALDNKLYKENSFVLYFRETYPILHTF